MRRPLIFRRSGGIGRLRGFYPLRERIEPGAQRGNLLLLSVHDIAELDVGALQERNFRFNPLDFFAGHNDSVADQQLKPNWWFPVPMSPAASTAEARSLLLKSLFL
jgi:hypothetical protein